MATTSGRAALALAGLLAWAALPPAPTPPDPCPRPAERRARAGHSAWVDCAGGEPLRGPARRLFGLPLDPNRADAATLEILPGIGPVRARAIVDERRRRPFARVSDLTRVRGIGPRTLARIAAALEVDLLREPALTPFGALGENRESAAPDAPRMAPGKDHEAPAWRPIPSRSSW